MTTSVASSTQHSQTLRSSYPYTVSKFIGVIPSHSIRLCDNIDTAESEPWGEISYTVSDSVRKLTQQNQSLEVLSLTQCQTLWENWHNRIRALRCYPLHSARLCEKSQNPGMLLTPHSVQLCEMTDRKIRILRWYWHHMLCQTRWDDWHNRLRTMRRITAHSVRLCGVTHRDWHCRKNELFMETSCGKDSPVLSITPSLTPRRKMKLASVFCCWTTYGPHPSKGDPSSRKPRKNS